MSLFVHPDPEEPAGGFAFLELPEGTLADATATVAVFDAYGERWLAPSDAAGARVEIGDANWQSDRVEFGPYEVHRHDGADWVRIGPEIVNKLEEYAPLRLEVSGKSHDVTWPDTVPPRAGAAVLGALQAVSRKQADSTVDTLVGRVPPPSEAPEPDPEPAPPPPPKPVEEPESARRKGSLIPLLIILALLAIGAGLAWYLWPQPEPEQQTTFDTPPVPATDPCSLASLRSLSGGFAQTAEAIRDCGADTSADTALRLIEDAAAENDGAALALFGTLYDGDVLDAPIENVIGLTFADDPAQAVVYYDRAVRAGYAPACDRRSATCARLATSDATLAKGAYDDFCVD